MNADLVELILASVFSSFVLVCPRAPPGALGSLGEPWGQRLVPNSGIKAHEGNVLTDGPQVTSERAGVNIEDEVTSASVCIVSACFIVPRRIRIAAKANLNSALFPNLKT